MSSARAFTLVEVVVAFALTCAITMVLLFVDASLDRDISVGEDLLALYRSFGQIVWRVRDQIRAAPPRPDAVAAVSRTPEVRSAWRITRYEVAPVRGWPDLFRVSLEARRTDGTGEPQRMESVVGRRVSVLAAADSRWHAADGP